MAGVLAFATGAILGVVVLGAGVAYLYVWLRACADLLLAALLKPWPTLVAAVVPAIPILTLASQHSDALLGLVATALITPRVALVGLDLAAWAAPPRAPGGAPALLRGAWRGAFERRERQRRRDAYQAFHTVQGEDF